ncbi:MAG: hypothetical protein HXX14_11735 [Bacteroidetes bacterium]|nr:hypothetical protein [Bacteroidota bacterium]
MASYFSKERVWTRKQIEPYNLACEIPLFYQASVKYNHPEYLKAISNLRTPALASDWKQLVLRYVK